MERLKRAVARLLCALVLCTGLPRLPAAPCGPGAAAPAPRSCCLQDCGCCGTVAAACACGQGEERAPEAPAPDGPQLPRAPAALRPEPVTATPPRSAEADRTARFGLGERQGRARHAVLSVWLI